MHSPGSVAFRRIFGLDVMWYGLSDRRRLPAGGDHQLHLRAPRNAPIKPVCARSCHGRIRPPSSASRLLRHLQLE